VLIEAQLEYALGALREMRERGLSSLTVRAEVQDAYNERVQKALAGTVWNSGGCQSYYLDRNGTNSTIYPWTTIDLRRRTSRFQLDEYLAREAAPEPVAA
jgi:cyclohexanone monooxygenase